MKLKQQDSVEILVPSSFTRGARKSDKEALETMYKNSISVLRRIKSLLESELDDYVKESEWILPDSHMEYVRNASCRSELRRIIKVYFPSDK